MNRQNLVEIDAKIIRTLRKAFLPASRLAIFIIYFWFGALKVFDLSPASPMVLTLLERTLPFIDPAHFLIGFGIYEMIIGIAFLIPHFEREAIALLIPHLISTILPLFVLTSLVWTAPFVPTMEGQYIIKNLLIAALAIGIASHLRPQALRD